MFGGGFPHGFFESAGGHGFGHHHGADEDKEVDNKALYDLLGVGQTAGTDEIKKAYKKLAMKHHPDKGGDPEKFKEISGAHEILTNPEKRETYDKYGLEGLKDGGAGGMDPFDIFGSLFGGGRGGRGGPKQQKKTKPQLKEVKVTLEDVYVGKMSKVSVNRSRACAGCNGKGAANVKKCSTCKGHGVVEKVVQIAPGFLSSSRSACHDCRGEGEVADKATTCKECKGNKMISDTKVIEVPIEQGVPDQHQSVFHGEGDEAPGTLAGDIVCQINIEPHPKFERKGADLFYKKKILLYEALTGCYFTITHLDGKKLDVQTKPGEVITPNAVKQINGKGMPFYKDAMSFGNLYIKFEVEFPKKGEMKNPEDLKKILPVPASNGVNFDKKNAEYLDVYDETSLNPNAEGGRNRRGRGDDDDDDEHPRGGQRVQCQQQ